MNATIMKGERSKLLAVVAVMALIACAAVALMPSDNVSAEPDVAMPEAVDGVITLTNDVALSTSYWVPEEVTEIDLGGFTITGPDDEHGIIVYAGADVLIHNGTITSNYTTNVGHATVYVNGTATFGENLKVVSTGDYASSWNNGPLTIRGGTAIVNGAEFFSEEQCGIAVMNAENDNVSAPGTLIFNSGTVECGLYAVSGNNTTSAGATIDINGGSFKTTYGNEVCMYFPMESTITIDNATIEGQGGIEIKMGSLTINNTTITATESYDETYVPGGNGCESNGSAIVVAAQKYGNNSSTQYRESPDLEVIIGEGCVFNTNGGNSLDVFNCKAVDDGVQIATVAVESPLESVRIINDAAGTDNVSVGVTLGDVEALTYTGDANVTVNGDVTLVACDGREIINNGNLTVGENASAKVSGNGKLMTEGMSIVGTTAYVGTWSQLNTVLTGAANYGVVEVFLTDDIIADSNFYANGRVVTLYTDGNDLTLNGTTNLTNLRIQVDYGSTLTLGATSITKFVSDESLQVLPGANFSKIDGALLGTGDITVSTSGESGSETTTVDGADILYPYLNDGSYVIYKGNLYKVNHFKSGEIYIQYGVSGGNVEFTGQAIIADQVPLLVQAFDNNVFNATGNPTYSLTALPEGESYTDAKTYTDAIAFRITFLDPNGVTGNGSVTVNGVADLIIQPTDPDQYDVKIEGWEFGSTPNEPTYTYSDIQGNQLPADNVIYSYEMKVDGVWTPVTVEPSEFGVGDYRVIATFAPFSTNYNEVTDSCEFKVTPTTLNVEFGTVDNDDDDMFWGTDPDRYMDFPYTVNETTTDTGKVITVSGGVYYIDDINDIEGITTESGTIYSGEMATGYYALLNIVNPNDFDLKMTITYNGENREYTIGGTDTSDNTKQMIFWLGTSLQADSSRTVEIEPVDNVDYGAEKYTFVFDVYRMTTAGYNADGAVQDLADEGFVRADATGNVMWIAYDGKEVVGQQPYGYLYYDGKLVYAAEDMTKTDNEYTQVGDSGRVWYFSFVSQVTDYVNANEITGYEPGQPGKYTMYISTVAPEDFVPGTSGTVAEATVFIEGFVDSGFSHYADAALKDLQNLYKAYGQEYSRSDITDNTLWFAWYQEGYEGQTIKAYVSTVQNNWDAENLWINGDPMYDMDGLRAFAWSFDNNEQGAKYVAGLELPETVYVKITATDADDVENIIAEGTIDIKDEASSVVIDDGMELSDILGKKPLDFMDITVNKGEGNGYTIRGDVYLIESWETYYAGVDTEGYYIALTVDPAVESDLFDWSQAKVTVVNPYNPHLEDENHTKIFDGTFDGQLLLYIGKDLTALTADDAQDITLKVDLDGAEPFLTEAEYTLDISGLEQGVRTYTVTYIDDAYGTTGYKVTEYIAGNILTLPVVPDTTKEALGWDVDDTGVLYKCGTRVDLSQLDTDGDYAVTFYAQYGPSTGGSTGDEPRQLWDYQYKYVYDAEAGAMTVYVVTDKLDGYKNVLTTISIAYTDWENGAGGNVTYYISEPTKLFAEGLGIVAAYTFENVSSEGVIHIDAFVGNTWMEQYDFDTTPAEPEPLLSEEMTFEIIEVPADAPADNNYPWLQVNYERLQTVDSVAFYVDDVQVTNLVWVDSTGEPVEGAPMLNAGTAYLQLSIADGEVTEGEHTFRIVATLGEQTETIEAQYTVTLQ